MILHSPMPSLHYFNPGHETAVWQGRPNYTPPANVRVMMRDLAYLPAWYGEAGDFVLVEQVDEARVLDFREQLVLMQENLPQPVGREALKQGRVRLPECEAAAWGWSPQAVAHFRALGQTHLRVPDWKEEYKELTARQTAARCLRLLKEFLPEADLPEVPVFCSTKTELRAFLDRHAGATCLLKSPFSSSGRGLLWLPEARLGEKEAAWARGVMEKQGAVSVELALEKLQDCAWEFYVDGAGGIRYEGLSVFGTGERGAYSGNLLGSETYREEKLAAYLAPAEILRIREALSEVLRQVFATKYRGYLGVDMLVYQGKDGRARLHPCVEINMRYTMGMVALRLSRLLEPGRTGYFRVEYEKEEGAALAIHRELQARHPLIINFGRIQKGYLSLCPVAGETHYRAYVVVE